MASIKLARMSCTMLIGCASRSLSTDSITLSSVDVCAAGGSRQAGREGSITRESAMGGAPGFSRMGSRNESKIINEIKEPHNPKARQAGRGRSLVAGGK
jgi:hypothetical protein